MSPEDGADRTAGSRLIAGGLDSRKDGVSTARGEDIRGDGTEGMLGGSGMEGRDGISRLTSLREYEDGVLISRDREGGSGMDGRETSGTLGRE